MYAPTNSPPLPPLASLIFGGELPEPSDPEGRAVREFLTHNWADARELLATTDIIRVEPLPPEGPRSFGFIIDRPYRRREPSGEITVDPGPITGIICYHASVLRPPRDSRSVVVFVTCPGFYHPNFGRKQMVLCLGDLPRQPLQLGTLIQHIYGIVAYQNLSFTSPLDPEAARYFATNPAAFSGLRPVSPIYP
jgi:hypothetical protein